MLECKGLNQSTTNHTKTVQNEISYSAESPARSTLPLILDLSYVTFLPPINSVWQLNIAWWQKCSWTFFALGVLESFVVAIQSQMNFFTCLHRNITKRDTC